MSAVMTPELQELVESIMAGGSYRDEAEVVGEALRLLQKRDQLKAEIQVGLDELDRGEWIDGELVFKELRARAAEIESQTK